MKISEPYFGFKPSTLLRAYYFLCYRPRFMDVTSVTDFLASYPANANEAKVLQELINILTLRLEAIKREEDTTLCL